MKSYQTGLCYCIGLLCLLVSSLALANNHTVVVTPNTSTTTTVSGNTETVAVNNVSTGFLSNNVIRHIALHPSGNLVYYAELNAGELNLMVKDPVDTNNVVLATKSLGTTQNQQGIIKDIAISPTGDKLYILITNSKILSVPLTTAAPYFGTESVYYSYSFDSIGVIDYLSNIDAMEVSFDGTKLFAIGEIARAGTVGSGGSFYGLVMFDLTQESVNRWERNIDLEPYNLDNTSIDTIGVHPSLLRAYIPVKVDFNIYSLKAFEPAPDPDPNLPTPFPDPRTLLEPAPTSDITFTGQPLFDTQITITQDPDNVDPNNIPTAPPRIFFTMFTGGSNVLYYVDTAVSSQAQTLTLCGGFSPFGVAQVSSTLDPNTGQPSGSDVLFLIGNGEGMFVDPANLPSSTANCPPTINLPPISSGGVALQANCSNCSTSTSSLAAFSLSGNQLNFCDVQVGDTVKRDLIVTNNDAAKPLLVSSNLSGNNFAIVDNTCNSQTLDAGLNCTIGVEFTPTSDSNSSGSISLAVKDGAAQNANPVNLEVALLGNGTLGITQDNCQNQNNGGGPITGGGGSGGPSTSGNPQQVNDSGSLGWIILGLLSLLFLGRRRFN